MMVASVPLIHTGEDQIGWMKAETWREMYGLLREQGVIQAGLNPDDLYTLQFLDAYAKGVRP